MSFDLFVFERKETIKTSLDVFSYLETFTEYKEEKDYHSLLGCSDRITNWAKKMFEKFPPMNGEDAPPDDLAFASEEAEAHLTDYSFGKNGVYCAFSYSVSEEAFIYAKSIANDCGVGLYNPQSAETFFGKGLEILKYRTESQDDSICDWQSVTCAIQSLDDPQRGTSYQDAAFITLWFEKDGVKGDYIQCSPKYETTDPATPKPVNPLNDKLNYFFEIRKANALYQTVVPDKAKLQDLVKAWCIDQKEPDISDYQKLFEWQGELRL